MKKRRITSIALFLALVLLMQAAIPIGASVSKAASSPKLNRSSITLEGVGDSYSLLVNNKVSGSYYSWSSSNKRIVAVNSYGMIKAISGGIATVKCKITYPTGRTKTLQCIVTVRVPATSLTISNAKMSANNTHSIKLGDSYNFNTTISPSGSTDNVYWKVEDTSIATVDNYGIVTAKKQGLTRLVATAANSKSKVSSSIVNDAINLYVAGQTAEVLSVTHVSATVVQISFSEAVNKDTIFHVDGSGKLLDNISFLAMRDEYGKMANGYGSIKGELSSDGTLLTLRSEFPFKGVYQLSVKSLSTVSNKVVETYVEKIDFNDKTAPTYVDTTLDETGLVATVNFSEPIDTTNLSIESVTRADGVAMNALSLAILRNKAIYTLSDDKMSLVVNMTNLNTNDKNKLIYVLMKGIKDISGNDIGLGSVTVQLTSDTTTKPQANVVSIVRTSYYNVAVTFDRTIMNPGTLYVQGYSATGTVDSKDKKVVNYTIPAAAAILTGTQNVMISGYSGYNVANGSYMSVSRQVDFTIAITQDAPKLTSYSTESATNMVTLNYSENVSLVLSSGTVFASVTHDMTNYTYTTSEFIPYQAVVTDNVVKLILDADYMKDKGTYLVTIPPAFVTDKDSVPNNTGESIAFIKTETSSGASANPLPAPISVTQSPTDKNAVLVTFGNKLDIATASNIKNYAINGGVQILSVQLIQNDASKAVVQLNVMPASILSSANYELVITDVKGYSGSYGSITSKPISISLTENLPPTLVSATLTSSTTIVLTFTEDVTGSLSCLVTQNGSTIALSGTPAVSGKYVTISLSSAANGASGLYVMVSSNLKDTNGNNAIISDAAIQVK